MQSVSLIEREEWRAIDLSRLKDNTEIMRSQLNQINALERPSENGSGSARVPCRVEQL
jgi:hypothetical protein